MTIIYRKTFSLSLNKRKALPKDSAVIYFHDHDEKLKIDLQLRSGLLITETLPFEVLETDRDNFYWDAILSHEYGNPNTCCGERVENYLNRSGPKTQQAIQDYVDHLSKLYHQRRPVKLINDRYSSPFYNEWQELREYNFLVEIAAKLEREYLEHGKLEAADCSNAHAEAKKYIEAMSRQGNYAHVYSLEKHKIILKNFLSRLENLAKYPENIRAYELCGEEMMYNNALFVIAEKGERVNCELYDPENVKDNSLQVAAENTDSTKKMLEEFFSKKGNINPLSLRMVELSVTDEEIVLRDFEPESTTAKSCGVTESPDNQYYDESYSARRMRPTSP